MASLSYANTYSYNLLTLIDEWQRSLVISFIEVDMTDMSLNDQIKNTIHLIGDSLQWISEKYREFREEVFDIPLALRGEIDEDLDKLLVEASKYLKKFKIFNELLTFYMDYQSWFEEFHFTKCLEDAAGDLKM